MEVLFLVLIAGGLLWYCWPKAKNIADVNDDGKVDVQDAKVVVAKVEDAIVAEGRESAAELAKTVEAKVEEVAAKVEEVAVKVEEEVKEVVEKVKKTRARTSKKK